jgi:hypothetical protein
MGLAIEVVPVNPTLNALNQPPANSREYNYRLYSWDPSTRVLARVPGVEPTSCPWPGGWGTFVPFAAGNVNYSPYEVSNLFVHVG